SYCRNKRYLERSIVEGYLTEECMTFCSRYLEDVETRLNKSSRNAGLTNHNLSETYLFRSYGQPIGKVEIAHLDDRYWYKQVLRSCSCSRRLQHREINKLFTKSFYE
ncbi:hypothetical protein J1N35_015418, partial [Gossypium stocksii]